MKSSKFYAVRQGRKTGIFDSWEECEIQVKGFRGAEYKSFKEKEKALNYLNLTCKEHSIDKNTTVAYVDGSYSLQHKISSYGVYISALGKEEYIKGIIADSENMRNVTGEIEASMVAINYCIKNSIKTLDIYYDYTGIEMWATKKWKANLNGTKFYQDYVESVADKITIRFHKVKSHSNDKYNDIADMLAKQAIEEYIKLNLDNE